MPDTGIRLQKYLASCGVASRRAAEELMLQGRVSVDGEVVRVLGTKVDPGTQKVKVDGETVRPARRSYFLVNKPRGYICSNAEEFSPKRAIDLVQGAPEGIFAAGRLDEDSEGLVFVTNDGAYANLVAHPRYGVAKTYRVLLRDRISEEDLDRLRKGVHLAEGKIVPLKVEPIGVHDNKTELEVKVVEGWNRVVRRMFAKTGHPVKRLTRTAIGPFTLGDLKPGRFKRLDPDHVARLMEAIESAPRDDRPHRSAPARGGRPGKRRPGDSGRD